MTDGLLLFSRYAYPPNRLGYCGSDDHESLLGYLSEGRADEGLGQLARRFEGAYPYLRLIALANGIGDPFDERVVEAYWISNQLLDRVGAAPFFESLKARFRPKMPPKDFAWMASALPRGAKPHHNFHVFDVYRRAGLMHDERAVVAIDRMDQCRISWGKVIMAEGAELVVERSPLVFTGGSIGLGAPRIVKVLRHLDARGSPRDYATGDFVSLHWNWACDRIGNRELGHLIRATRRALYHTNLTL